MEVSADIVSRGACLVFTCRLYVGEGRVRVVFWRRDNERNERKGWIYRDIDMVWLGTVWSNKIKHRNMERLKKREEKERKRK